MLENLPDPGAWNRVSRGRKADPFRVRLNKNETDRMPPRWAEGNFSIEIEELEGVGRIRMKDEDETISSSRHHLRC